MPATKVRLSITRSAPYHSVGALGDGRSRKHTTASRFRAPVRRVALALNEALAPMPYRQRLRSTRPMRPSCQAHYWRTDAPEGDSSCPHIPHRQSPAPRAAIRRFPFPCSRDPRTHPGTGVPPRLMPTAYASRGQPGAWTDHQARGSIA